MSRRATFSRAPGPRAIAGRCTRFWGRNEVEAWKPPQQLVALLLGDAAPHSDHELRLAALAGEQDAELGVEPVLGLLPDRARVDHDDVRGLGSLARGQPRVVQQVRHLLRIVLVHLTAEGADVEPSRCRSLKRLSSA
jgi:hypothetical protein